MRTFISPRWERLGSLSVKGEFKGLAALHIQRCATFSAEGGQLRLDRADKDLDRKDG